MTNFLFTGPNLLHGTYGHAMVKINDDLIVIGGITPITISSALYRLTYSNGQLQWFNLTQKFKIPRSNMVAVSIPPDFFHG